MSDLPTPLVFVDAPAAPTHVNALPYGPSGAGKSTLAATAPGPILWINLEGPNALAYARRVAKERGTEIREVAIEHKQDPRPTIRGVIEYVRANPDVQTVVVDTIGKLRDALTFAIGGNKPSLPQWGEIGNTLADMIRILRDLPVNLIVIAHEEIKDSDDGDRIVRPMIGGATTEKVIADMDIVAYMGVSRDDEGQIRYLAQFVENRGRRAKDRSGGLGQVRGSDFADWLAAYRDALGATDDSDLPFTAQESLDDAIVAGAVQTEAA